MIILKEITNLEFFTPDTLIKELSLKGFVEIDDEGRDKKLFAVVASVTRKNFPDMSKALVDQLKEEGKLGGFITFVSKTPRAPFTVLDLAVFGRSDKYETKWIFNNKTVALNAFKKEFKSMDLVNRANDALISKTKRN